MIFAKLSQIGSTRDRSVRKNCPVFGFRFDHVDEILERCWNESLGKVETATWAPFRISINKQQQRGAFSEKFLIEIEGANIRMFNA